MMTLVVGAGAIGIAIATFLRSQDVQVDILARERPCRQSVRMGSAGMDCLASTAVRREMSEHMSLMKNFLPMHMIM